MHMQRPGNANEKTSATSKLRRLRLAAVVLPLLFTVQAGPVQAQEKNGTTLAAYKTVDICEVDASTWRYSGVIAVWNEGVIATSGLKIVDTMQFKTGTNWLTGFDIPIMIYSEIPAGTTLETATIFPLALTGDLYQGRSVTWRQSRS